MKIIGSELFDFVLSLMSVYVSVCVYIYMFVCIHGFMSVNVCVYIYICMHMYIYEDRMRLHADSLTEIAFARTVSHHWCQDTQI